MTDPVQIRIAQLDDGTPSPDDMFVAFDKIGAGTRKATIRQIVESVGIGAPAIRGVSGTSATLGPTDIGKVVAFDHAGPVAVLLTDCSSGVVGGGAKLNKITIIVANALGRMNLSLDTDISLDGGAWSPLTGIGIYEIVTGDGLHFIRSSMREVTADYLVQLLAVGIEAVDLNGQKITGLANGTSAQDAAAFGQIPTASSSTPSAVATAGAAGAATTWSKSDHTHAIAAATIITAMASAASALAMNAQKITGVADPTAAQDAATKAYVDAIAQGLSVKQSVRVATIANGTLATAFANGQTVDGVVLATGDRILLKDQTTQADRGIYTVNASGAPTRATDWDASADLAKGAFVFVQEGTANADSGWVLITDGTIVVGTTAIAFTQFSGAGQITAGSGITKSGNTLSADTTVVVPTTRTVSAGTGVTGGGALSANITISANFGASGDIAALGRAAAAGSAGKVADAGHVHDAGVIAIQTKSANFTLANTDSNLHIDTSSGAVSVTLPAASLREWFFKKTAGANKITLLHGSVSIEGSAADLDLPGSTSAPSSSSPQAWRVYSDGTNWFIA